MTRAPTQHRYCIWTVSSIHLATNHHHHLISPHSLRTVLDSASSPPPTTHHPSSHHHHHLAVFSNHFSSLRFTQSGSPIFVRTPHTTALHLSRSPALPDPVHRLAFAIPGSTKASQHQFSHQGPVLRREHLPVSTLEHIDRVGRPRSRYPPITIDAWSSIADSNSYSLQQPTVGRIIDPQHIRSTALRASNAQTGSSLSAVTAILCLP